MGWGALEGTELVCVDVVEAYVEICRCKSKLCWNVSVVGKVEREV